MDIGANLSVTSQVLNPYGAIAAYASMGDPKPAFPCYDLFRLNPTIRPVLVYTLPDAAKARAHADISRWLAYSPYSRDNVRQQCSTICSPAGSPCSDLVPTLRAKPYLRDS